MRDDQIALQALEILGADIVAVIAAEAGVQAVNALVGIGRDPALSDRTEIHQPPARALGKRDRGAPIRNVFNVGERDLAVFVEVKGAGVHQQTRACARET